MIKNAFFAIFLATLTVGLSGCKPAAGFSNPHAGSGTASNNYFHTDFQDESQFIVETIVSDLAEQIYYAKFHQVPDQSGFHVSADETADSSFGAPVYDVQVDLDAKYHGFKTRLKVNGPIWSPEVYDDLTAQLSQLVGLTTGTQGNSTDIELLSKLTDGTATTIEQENQHLSKALENNFSDGSLHEKAALLLGAFTLREHSGDFYEIRSPLCRITAHLAMARYLDGKNLSAINGRMAEAILYTLMNNEADALQKLKNIPTTDPAVVSWVRALQARNTGDYRPLDKLNGLSQIECINWFYALDPSADTGIAWSKLNDAQKRTPDFVRIANENDYPVGVGHELLALSIPAEFEEISTIYQISQNKKLGREEFVPALNWMPDRCFSPGADGTVGVHVIGWGLWSGFFQRQFCHAIEHDFDFLERKWGVPDDAKSFSDKCDARFGDLRLYPFVRRLNAVDSETYHKSVDDGFKVTVATPQLVPAECWDYLDYWLNRNDYYHPNPNPHINEWHKHNPPPGTAYNPLPRMDHPSLVWRPDSTALLDKLHEMAPYDKNISWYIWKTKYKENPTYDQALTLFKPILPFSVYAMRKVANTVTNQPDLYEILLSKSATLNPSDYFTLADYFLDRKQNEKATQYYEKGAKMDPDPLSIAAHANWLIHYYLRNGRTQEARRLADFAGDVYSEKGLEAKADYLEATDDPDGAFEWFSKIEERYNDSSPMVAFCLRYKAKTGDNRFDYQLQSHIGKLFPQGMEKVKLDDFHSPPTDGVVFTDESDLLRAAGLSKGDIIVAVYGIRVHDSPQYNYGRKLSSTPELDLIVWQQRDHAYHEIKCNPPNHLFGVRIDNYRSP